MKDRDLLIVIVGYFNQILSEADKLGGASPNLNGAQMLILVLDILDMKEMEAIEFTRD